MFTLESVGIILCVAFDVVKKQHRDNGTLR